MLLTIINIVTPVFAIIALGAAWGHWRRPDLGPVNRLNMEVFVPALVFSVMASKEFEIAAYLQLAAGVVVVVLGSGLVLWPLTRLMDVSVKTFLPPMMFNNTGNMGIPLMVLAFGDAALPPAVMVFIVSMLLHFTLGLYMLDHRSNPIVVLKNPVLQATCAGLVFSLAGWTLPQAIALPIDMLGQVAIPLMLFTLGVRLLDVDFGDLRLGVLGAIACPASGVAMALLMHPLLDLPGDQWGILLVYAVLPPAVLNYMLAEQYHQEPRRVASIVLIGNFASLLFIPLALWWALS